jgi:hypothetical protein
MFSKIRKYNNSTLGGILIHLILAGILMLGLALLFFYWYLPNITNKGESITVPNIEGLSIEKLEEVLGDRSLRWEVDDSA